jgi:hypothetical protein
MNNSFSGNRLADEGYVYVTYGEDKYLKHAVASVATLRRYDNQRPVAIFCSSRHQELLAEKNLDHLFTYVYNLPVENQSINGFKHNLYKFTPFQKNLFIDSDIVWCRYPDRLWVSLSAYPFTITGNQTADLFFGAPKGIRVLKDLFLGRRDRTLQRFNLTYLSRVQAGMIYISDTALAERVCNTSKEFFQQRGQTHFRSRREEEGRNDESCEWSLAMAMARLELQVIPWLNGYESPQLDFIENYTTYDEEFHNVKCLLYSNRFIYDLKGLKTPWLQKALIKFFSFFPGRGDYLYVTPYCLHFGWYHQKEPLNKFAEKCWHSLARNVQPELKKKTGV